VFRCWDDFTPACLAEQIPEVKEQIDVRDGLRRLRDLCRRYPEVRRAILQPAPTTIEPADDSPTIDGTLDDVLVRLQASLPTVDHNAISKVLVKVKELCEASTLRAIYGDNVFDFLAALIDDADRRISRQLHAVTLSEDFVAIASAWLGLKYLSEHAARLPQIQLKVEG
jgi:hypothetical protein